MCVKRMRIRGLALAFAAAATVSLAAEFPETTCGKMVQAASRRIKVACIGDSITFGFLLAHPEQESFPGQLQRMLGDGYEVRNFGVPGLGVYLHLPWKSQKNGKRAWSLSPKYAEAMAWKPDIVISNLGANDLDEYPKEFLPGADCIPALTRGTFRRQYADVLNAFKSGGSSPRILMWTRLCAMKGARAEKYGLTMAVMAEDLERVAAEVGAEGLDIYSVTKDSAANEEWPDMTHPPVSGHQAIAEAILKVLRRPSCE